MVEESDFYIGWILTLGHIVRLTMSVECGISIGQGLLEIPKLDHNCKNLQNDAHIFQLLRSIFKGMFT